MNLVLTRMAHFAACLGPVDGSVEHEYCYAYFSGATYPVYEDLKVAVEAHVEETGHRVHIGRFACIEPERQTSMDVAQPGPQEFARGIGT